MHFQEAVTLLVPIPHLWLFYPAGIDILKLVAAQVGSQWKDIYQFLCNASEREVAAFSNGYAADHERAYAALQHWTIRGPEASLAQLISALRQHRRNDVVEKIRGLMEDTTPVRPGTVLSCLVHCRALLWSAWVCIESQNGLD